MGRWGALRGAASTLGATLAVLGVLELGIRAVYRVRTAASEEVVLPYVLGHSYGPAPPWVDGMRILEDDEQLFWRGRPHVRQTYVDVFAPAHRAEDRTALLHRFRPGVPAALRGQPTWEVRLNSEGFRDEELPDEKDPGVLRVVCIGDSWTFGANVGPRDSFPRQLEARLRQALPSRRVEVLNLGVLGYSSHQGLRLLRERVLSLEPDFVTIGFAMNDSSMPGYRDTDLAGMLEAPSLGDRVGELLEHVEWIRLLRYAVKRASWRPSSPGKRLAAAQQAPVGAVDFEAHSAWTRVPPPLYEENLRTMIELVRSTGAEPLLVYNEFELDSPYRETLRRLSRNHDVPLVDSSELIASERARLEAAVQEELGLAPAGRSPGSGAAAVEVVFRVRAAPHAVPERLYVVGTLPELGGGEPNRIPLHDDGTGGDERAADGVWTAALRLSEVGPTAYVYTNSGRPGHWEGLDVPAVRRVELTETDAGARLVRPVEQFGRLALHADPWHTDARGYGLVADALAETILRSPRLEDRVGMGARSRRPKASPALAAKSPTS